MRKKIIADPLSLLWLNQFSDALINARCSPHFPLYSAILRTDAGNALGLADPDTLGTRTGPERQLLKIDHSEEDPWVEPERVSGLPQRVTPREE